jgi:hypothetical protein
LVDSHFIKIQKIGMAIFLGGITALSACSFKETKNSTVSDLSIDATYSSMQAKVFTPKCVSCHSGSAAPHGIVLNSYASIVHNGMFPPLVVPGNPETSSLYQAVADGSMPKNQAPLSPKALAALYVWIKSGAPETEGPINPTPTPSPTPPDCQPNEPGC